MANAVQATFGIDSTQYNQKIAEMDSVSKDFANKQKSYASQQHAQFERELQDLDRKVKAQNEINQALYNKTAKPTSLGDLAKDVEKVHGHMPGLNMVLRETLVIFREIGRGNWARVPGSFSMVVQGLIQMRDSLGVFGKLFTLTGGAIVAVLAAIGYGAYKVYEYFKILNESIADAGNKFGRAKTTMEQLNDAMKKTSESASEFNKWLHSLGNNIETVDQKTERLLKRMREQFKMEVELAKLRHSSPAQIEKMEEKQLQKELDLIEKAKDAAYQKRDADKADAIAIEKQITSKSNAQSIADMENAGKDRDSKAKIIDAIRASLGIGKMEDLVKNQGAGATITKQRIGIEQYSGQAILENYQANVSDEIAAMKQKTIDVEVDGQKYHGTLEDAMREMAGADSDYKKLKNIQDELSERLSSKKKFTEEDNKAIQNLAHQESELLSQMSNKNKYGNAIAAAEKSGNKGYALNAEQRIGAYAATPPDMKMLIELNKQIAANTKKPATAGSSPAPKGPRYSSSGGVTTIDYTNVDR